MRPNTLTILKQNITTLVQHFEHLISDQWNDELLKIFSLKVVHLVEDLLSQDNYDELLKNFLREHWLRIRKSALSYTAIPDAMITRFLCELAEMLSDNKVSPIALLMPGVNIESLTEKYKNLDEIPLEQII